ncbi:arylamine N-acetyltransferase family protein [Brevibacillus nitrificans]|nr:arylamine N-acetyltransferase [Brevibacillus nitrificans]
MDEREYFRRMGVKIEDIRIDYESLCLIQERHMLSIPFENLDIMSGRPVAITPEALHDKIVGRKRGGYCYELNGLLALMLQKVGFSVTLLSGRVWRRDGSWGPEFDHMALLVHLEEDYFVDVGFGDSARLPMRLTGEVVEDAGGAYRIMADSAPNTYLFQKRTEEGWSSTLQFTTTPRRLEDFSEMNHEQQTSPNSHFAQRRICSLAMPTGRITISGDTFIETNGTAKTTRQIKSDEELEQLLRSSFGLAKEK